MTVMTPSEAPAETLRGHGVSHVFGIVGSAMLDFLDTFEHAGLRFVPVRHEGVTYVLGTFCHLCLRVGH